MTSVRNYDVVIKAHNKDYHKLGLVVESLQHLKPQPEHVYIVSSDGYKPEGTTYDSKIITVLDENVTPFIDRSRLKHRPNWNWVNLVSILQNFTKNDLYFDVQADNFFVKDVELFDENGKPKIFRSTANPVNNAGHQQYFNFSESVFGIERISTGFSYIIEFMMYDRKILSDLFTKFDNHNDLMNCIYANTSDTSYPADQEIFGNLLEKRFPDSYRFVSDVTVHLQGIGGDMFAPVEYLEEYIRQVKIHRPDVTACSHHTWI